MKKTVWALGILFVMLSCGSWFNAPAPSRGGMSSASPMVASEKSCPRQQTVNDLIADLERCEAQLVVKDEPSEGAAKVQVKEKVVVKTKRCADAGPVLVPVPTTKCSPGQLCLDDDAQIAYAKNQMAYETWIKEVQECERQ